jgi:hypothetical protein
MRAGVRRELNLALLVKEIGKDEGAGKRTIEKVQHKLFTLGEYEPSDRQVREAIRSYERLHKRQSDAIKRTMNIK